MARSVRLLKVNPDPRREPPSRARYRVRHVTVGVMMSVAERDALAARAAAAGVSMGALLRGDERARATELKAAFARGHMQGAAEAVQEHEAEMEALGKELAKVTADGRTRALSVAAAWRAAFEAERDGLDELRAVVQARVPLAIRRPDPRRPSYLEDFDARLRARLGKIPSPTGGWPEA